MFKCIPDYDNYSVNESGIVINNKSRRALKQYKKISRNSGYMSVYLYNQDGRKELMVHRLVATTFIPNPDNLPQVNHKDENSLNNCADNLEWCDAKYNNSYGSKPKLQSIRMSGALNPFHGRKHTVESRKRMAECKRGKPSNNRKKVIVDGIWVFDSLTECADFLGISLTQTFNIIHHKRKSLHRIEYYEEVA